MMPVEIAETAIRPLYTAAAVLLVERRFMSLLAGDVAVAFTVLPFEGLRIGDGTTGVVLETLGVPAAPMFVVEPPGSPMGAALFAYGEAAKLPRQVSVLELRPGGLLGGSPEKRLARFLEESAAAVLSRVAVVAAGREAEVQALRNMVADQSAKLGRMRDALGLAGFSGEEFSLPLGARPVSGGAAATVNAPLYGVGTIRLRPTSADTGRVRVAFTANGREVESSIIEMGGSSPTLDIVVPAELTASRDSSEIRFEALRADGTPVGEAGFGSVLFRLDGGTDTPAPQGGTPRLAFASARFASLANAVSFCDGPLEELALNTAQGFSAVSVGDGTSFLQTHPVPGRYAGARLPRLIPFGATDVWLDIENAHGGAKPFEFIAVITPAVRTEPIDDWMNGLGLPAHTGNSTIERDDLVVTRTSLEGGKAGGFHIHFERPLPYDGTLYCLVRALDGDVSFGWCRWHRIVVGLPG